MNLSNIGRSTDPYSGRVATHSGFVLHNTLIETAIENRSDCDIEVTDDSVGTNDVFVPLLTMEKIED